MFRVFLLSLCMGCMGIAQQIPSCRLTVPAAVLGKEPVALARDYAAHDLKIRLGGRTTSADLAINRAERLTILLDHRESMADFWPTATQSLREVLAEISPDERLSVFVMDEDVSRIEGIEAAQHAMARLSGETPKGKRSLYETLEAVSKPLQSGDAVLVLTAGMDTLSDEETKALQSSLLDRGVRVNSLLFLRQGWVAVNMLMGPHTLKTLAYGTGGSATALKPLRQPSRESLLPREFMSEVLNYSVLELRVPEGNAPQLLAVRWRRGGKDQPRLVVPDIVGPCPATVSASVHQEH